MTLREIAEKHGRSIHYNMFSHDEVAFLLDAVVAKEITIHGLLCNLSKCDHKAATLRELNLKGVWPGKEE